MGDSSVSARDRSAPGLQESTREYGAFDDAEGGGADESRRPSSTMARIDRYTSESTDSVESPDPRASTTGEEAPPSPLAPGAYGVAPGSGAVRMAKQLREERRLAGGLNRSTTLEHLQDALSSPTSPSVSSLSIHELPNLVTFPRPMPTPATTDFTTYAAFYQAEAELAPPRPVPSLSNSAEGTVPVAPHYQPAVPVTETGTVDPQKPGTKVTIYATLFGVLLLLAGIGVGVGVGMSSATNAPAARPSSTTPSPASSTVSDHAKGSDSKQASKLIHGNGIT
jgi:hypothetical protein